MFCDFVDIHQSDIIDAQLQEFPETINLSKMYRFRVVNQHNLQMCKVCSWILCIEYVRQLDGYDYKRFSIPYVYFYSTMYDEDPFCNKPVSSKAVITSLLNNGVCEEIYWKSVDILEPSKSSIHNAETHKYYTIFERLDPDISVLKFILGHCRRPVVCDILINPQNFKSNYDEVGTFRHSVLLVGYEDEHFIFQNSYGHEWGNEGFGKIHFKYISTISECYSIPSSCIKSDLF